MGLFDGAGRDGEAGSTAALARLTGWPVVLVVDARGQGASAAALVAGFARHDPAVPLAGVAFNRVAGARHRELLESALARHLPELPYLGAVSQDPALTLPERHLGLIPAGEQQCEVAITRAARAVTAGIDIERLLALARPSSNREWNPAAVPTRAEPAIPGANASSLTLPRLRERAGWGYQSTSRATDTGAPLAPLGRRIAVARDDAFVFIYPSVLSGWRDAGAELSFFSPLDDQAPDSRRRCLPTGRLSRIARGPARRFRAVSSRAAAGRRRRQDDLRRVRRLHGVGREFDRGRRTDAPDGWAAAARDQLREAPAASWLSRGDAARRRPAGIAGTSFRGHEFHYATPVSSGDAAPLFEAADSRGADLGRVGLRRGSVSGSFIHLIDRTEA